MAIGQCHTIIFSMVFRYEGIVELTTDARYSSGPVQLEGGQGI
jgi:hypothetical protein